MSGGTFGFKGFKDRALELPAGVTSALSVAVSPLGRARLRYNDVAKQMEQSIDGGAYTPLGGTGAGPWDQVGTDVFPDSTGWNVTIGAAAVVGTERLRVVGTDAGLGGIRIESNPAFPSCYLEMNEGDGAALSSSDEGRLRYSKVNQRFEVSEDGGAYVPISADSGPWDETAGVVSTDNVAWTVVMGAAAMAGSERLRVVGAARIEGSTTSTSRITANDSFQMDAGFALFNVDNDLGQAFLIRDATDNRDFFEVDTSDGAELLRFGNAAENPAFIWLGSGDHTFGSVAKLFGADGDFVVGGTAMSGTERLRVIGDARVEGKLTVVGLIDPTGLVVDEQSTVPGGPPGTAKGTFWVKDDSPNKPYFTDDAGTDHDLLSASAGPWDETAGVVSPDNVAWNVVVGAAAMSGSEKFRVVGDVSLTADIAFEHVGVFSSHTLKANDAPAESEGAAMLLQGGRGGTTTTSGKQGGFSNLKGGKGGAGTAAVNAGRGGGCQLLAGTGGDAIAPATGGQGGLAALFGGTGGGPDGPGGDVQLQAGQGTGSGAGAVGGDVQINAGAPGSGASTAGVINVGNQTVSVINVGHAAGTPGNPPTNFLGTGFVTFNSIARVDPSDGGSIWGATSRHASALLQADSTTKGFLPPRMTRDQRNLIAGPATGLEVHNTSRSGSLDFYDGTQWREVAPPIDGGLQTGPVSYSASIDELIRCDPSLGVPTITLPSAVGVAMRAITIKEVTGSASPINVNTTGGQTIDGVAGPPADTITTAYGAATYISDGANWMKFT